ncbi:MAG: NAD(P)H-binding protein [Sphingobacteriales bacterium]|nr:NAD(P)H-binding protein [Sphingobacteriales bacterium]MBI3719876.1 NAD(P)H-binding protein [Sphingobacteriales bacterium]
MHSVLVLGASGLIGNNLTDLLLKDNSITKVYVLVRRSLNIQHSKLEERIINFSDIDAYSNNFPQVDTIFCCIGTTQKQVKGNNDLYRSIDFDIPVNAAKIGLEKGVKKYVIVSAIGSNSKSSNFYVKLKGQVEEAIAALPFDAVHIMRPSLLLGYRKEFRLAERIFQAIMKPLNFLVPAKYKAIEGSQVAAAMLKADKSNEKGVHSYTYKKMTSL